MSKEMSKNNGTDSSESVLCMIAGWKKERSQFKGTWRTWQQR